MISSRLEIFCTFVQSLHNCKVVYNNRQLLVKRNPGKNPFACSRIIVVQRRGIYYKIVNREVNMSHCGYSGKLLRVNLGNGDIRIEKPEEAYYKRYLGGRGIIMHTLLTETPAKADPLGAENKLIFALGPLTGHNVIGTGRCSVGAKSPLTGACGESEAGGMWGVELRRAGYDAIIVEDQSEKPVFLWIHDDTVEIRDAAPIWGSEIREAMEWFQDDIGEKKYRTALIGPSGEKGVRLANIIADCRNAFGRCGLGAVMGSKKLKAVVVKGSRRPAAADTAKILALNRIMKERYKNSRMRQYGTGSAMDAYEAVGNLPIRNYAGGKFPQAEKISAVAVMRQFGTGMEGCFNCPIKCKKKICVDDAPWHIDSMYGGPEYETLVSFGSNLLIDDLKAICKAHEICNRYGIDTISTGATVAFAMECFENGLLTTADADGLQLKFGNVEAMLQLVEKIARREGIGELLANGSKKAAEIIGKNAIQYAMQVKGLELPYHSPRLNQGLSIHYSVHASGADHVTGPIDHGLAGMMDNWDRIHLAENLPPTEMSPRKARMIYELGLYKEMPNYLGICSFVPWNISELRDAVEAVTGWPATTWKLMKAVERGITLMRIFNLREGFTRDDDRLPERFHHVPQQGPLKNVRIDPQAHREAVEIYYQLLGWDRNGVPTKACLTGLDLEWAVPCLES
jgi:aldehyde:ferredoxin oxidoreductase